MRFFSTIATAIFFGCALVTAKEVTADGVVDTLGQMRTSSGRLYTITEQIDLLTAVVKGPVRHLEDLFSSFA